MTATAVFDPADQPITYLIQFSNPGAADSKHLLVFEETPNPALTTGQQNELEVPDMAVVALGQWMRRDRAPSLRSTPR